LFQTFYIKTCIRTGNRRTRISELVLKLAYEIFRELDEVSERLCLKGRGSAAPTEANQSSGTGVAILVTVELPASWRDKVHRRKRLIVGLLTPGLPVYKFDAVPRLVVAAHHFKAGVDVVEVVSHLLEEPLC
jgi:hypothetical protein